ncbi:unnamed protein product [Polarella glacialis]|uniref:RING-type domain-containing protein n=1 Tax=Polarella glacialis TaxID=89957 RepID=A0A813G5D4_POLGL|nr:unnamed protein product [Polarella glacialis]CAE8622205.1 unnamed protein product [Polarella glacialis]
MAHERHKFRPFSLMAVLALTLAEQFFVVVYTMPLTQLLPGKEMLFMVGAAAAIFAATLRLVWISLQFFNNNKGHNTSAVPQLWCQALSGAMVGTQVLLSLFLAVFIAPWCALLLLTSAALDLLLLLLLRPTGVLSSSSLSSTSSSSSLTWSSQLSGSPQQPAEVAIEECQMPNLWEQRDPFHDFQAVEFKNFTWPSRGTRALGKQTPGFEENTCMVCLADFVAGELLSSLPCGHSFHAACITNWQQHSKHNTNNNSNNSNNHCVSPCRCTTGQPLVTVRI